MDQWVVVVSVAESPALGGLAQLPLVRDHRLAHRGRRNGNGPVVALDEQAIDGEQGGRNPRAQPVAGPGLRLDRQRAVERAHHACHHIHADPPSGYLGRPVAGGEPGSQGQQCQLLGPGLRVGRDQTVGDRLGPDALQVQALPVVREKQLELVAAVAQGNLDSPLAGFSRLLPGGPGARSRDRWSCAPRASGPVSTGPARRRRFGPRCPPAQARPLCRSPCRSDGPHAQGASGSCRRTPCGCPSPLAGALDSAGSAGPPARPGCGWSRPGFGTAPGHRSRPR